MGEKENCPICNYYHYKICCAEVLANDIEFTTVNESAFITDIESEGDTKIELVKWSILN
jgi:hypothetical protein